MLLLVKTCRCFLDHVTQIFFGIEIFTSYDGSGKQLRLVNRDQGLQERGWYHCQQSQTSQKAANQTG